MNGEASAIKDITHYLWWVLAAAKEKNCTLLANCMRVPGTRREERRREN